MDSATRGNPIVVVEYSADQLLAGTIAISGGDAESRQLVFTSQEYINRGRNDTEFVYDLYKAFLYREPDSGGWSFWVSQIQSNGRDNVRLAFELAPEFHDKVAGISPYGPPAGVTIPRDGLQGLAFDPATNRVTTTG